MRKEDRLMKTFFAFFGLCGVLLLTLPVKLDAQWVRTDGPYGANVSTIVVSGVNLFAGTKGGGVFLSTNNGTSWAATYSSSASTGINPRSITALAVSGSSLLAGTENGLFLSTDNGTTWTAASDPEVTAAWVNTLAVSGTSVFAGLFDGGGIHFKR